jgi:hypothetical protein
MVSKFTSQPKNKEVVSKINDVIDAIPAAQVQSNWNETNTSSKAYIQNKPTIPDAQIQADWNQTTTTAKDYIKNKPTIPTVNNATLTIQKNGTTVKTFTANASSDVTCNITVPTKVSELTNDSGFVTTDNDTKYTAGSSNSTSKLFLVGATAQGTAATNAQAKTTYSNSAVYEQNGYLYATTPTSSTNDTTVATTAFVKAQGYTSNTGTVTSVNNVSPVNGNVTLSIPTYNFNGEPFYSTNGNATTITRDCNSLTANGHYYYTSNGPSGLGEQSTDGAVYVQGYNDLWVTQIAQDYRTGNLFVRSRNSGTWTAWKAIGTSSGADTDLSNLSATGKAVLDGQWVIINEQIYSGSVNGSTALEKKVTLPNDGHIYEVLISTEVETGTTSGNLIAVILKSDILTNYASVCAARTRASSAVASRGSIIIPAKYNSSKNIYIYRSTGYTGTATITALAYRRVGTNT